MADIGQEAVQLQPLKPTSAVEHALVTDVPWMSGVYSNTNTRYTNYIDDSFSMIGNDSEELFKQYGVLDEGDKLQFSANNKFYLEQQLRAHQTYKDSEKELDAMGFVPSTLAHIGAGVLNPLNYAIGAGTYSLGGRAMAKLISAESSALQTLGRIGQASIATTVDVGLQEKIVQEQASAFDLEKYSTVVGASALFGGAVGGMAQFLSRGTPEQTQRVIRGITELNDNENEMINPISKFMVSTQAQVLRSKNPRARAEALSLEHSSIPVGNKETGMEAIQTGNTAKDVKNKAEALYTGYMNDEMAAANFLKKNPSAHLEEINTQKMLHDYDVERSSYEEILQMSEEAQIAKYIDETDTPITRESIPEDFYDVLLHSKYKEKVNTVEVPQHLQGITKFYEGFADMATDLGTRGVAGKVGKFFNTRVWNSQKLEQMGFDEASTRITEMMKNHPLTAKQLEAGNITEAEIVAQARTMVNNILENNLRKMFTEESYVRRAGAGDPTKQRVMKVDVSLYPDMFVQDADIVTQRYTQKMSGRLAMNSIGVDVTPDTKSFGEAIENRLSEVVEEGRRLGLSNKEITNDVDNLRVMYDVIMNTRQIVNTPNSLGHKATAALRGTASAIYSSGFVKSAVGELGSILLNSNFDSVIRTFVPAHKQTLSLLKQGDNKLARELVGMGIGRQVVEGNRFSRFDIDEIKAQTSWWERGLQKIGHYSRKWSGFNFVTATSDYVAANAFLRDLARASKSGNISKRFSSQLSRYGMSQEDALAFNTKAKVTYHSDGITIKELDMDNWGDEDYAWKVTRAITRMVDDTILRGDGLKMPKYLTDVNSDILRLFTQYQHFPIEAYERLMLRGMAESPARLMAGTITSSMIIMSVLQLEDEAQVQLGLKKERLPLDEIASRAFQKSPMASVAPDVYGLAKNLTGQADHYIPDISSKGLGASGHIIETSWDLYRKASNNQHLTDKDKDKIFRLTPFSRFPIYGELMRGLVKETLGD